MDSAERQKIKQQLKLWENDFFKSNQRKPRKEDINAAPDHVRQLYKRYTAAKSTSNPWDVAFHVTPANPVTEQKVDTESATNRIARKLLSNLKENLLAPENALNKKTKRIKETEHVEPTNEVLVRSYGHCESSLAEKCGNLEVDSNSECDRLTKYEDIHNFPISSSLSRPIIPKKRSGTFLNRSIPLHFLKDDIPKTKPTRSEDSLSIDKTPIRSNQRNGTSSLHSPESPIDRPLKPPRQIAESSPSPTSISVPHPKPDARPTSPKRFSIISPPRQQPNNPSTPQSSTTSQPVAATSLSSQPRPSKSSKPKSSKSSQPKPSVSSETKLSASAQPAASCSKRSRTSQSPDSGAAKRPRVANSSGDTNYVRLNLRVKRFARKGMLRQRQARTAIRREKWRRKFGGPEGQESKCFLCGNEGHWAKKCPGRRQRPAKPPEDSGPMEPDVVARSVDLERLELAAQFGEPFDGAAPDSGDSGVAPLFASAAEAAAGASMITTALRSKFGLRDFRPGQREAIEHVLCGRSALLMMPTGGGKSLCYQLPALLLQQHRPGSVVLVVSPLISLMEDQLRSLPAALHAGHLNSALSYEKRDQMVAEARAGKLAFLLVSPEALVEQGRYATRDSLPPISFVCIDEVHCLADWSHHFRPSYLRVCAVLRTVFGVRCFLGLTATCTRRTMERLAASLGVEPNGCIRSPPLPPNLVMSASRDANKEEALVELLRAPRMRNARGVIVYCASRDLTERVASYVRTALRFDGEEEEEKEEEKKGRKRKKKGPKWTAEAYHAGLTTAQRSRLQKQFIRGALRVLVATIAFGMGLDKSDVDAVIHFNAPKSFENYVQEVGRAGRDGSTAQCHVLLDRAQDALNDLKRHIYANSVDPVALKKLLRSVFASCGCTEQCQGHLRAIPIEEITEAMNVREETVATILCYLVVFEGGSLMKLERTVLRNCKISCYKGGRALRKATHKSLALAAALQLHGAFGGNDAVLEVDLVALCERFGWSYASVRKELAGLEWGSEDGQAKKTGLKVEFVTKAWLVRVRGVLTEAMFDQLMAYLQGRLEQLENDAVTNLSGLHRAFNEVAFGSAETCLSAEEADLTARSSTLTTAVTDFFDDRAAENEVEAPGYPAAFEAGVRAHVRSFISIYRHDHKLTGRTIACILHGIGTPLFPAMIWGRVRRFWRSQLSVDWPTLRRWATEELVGN